MLRQASPRKPAEPPDLAFHPRERSSVFLFVLPEQIPGRWEGYGEVLARRKANWQPASSLRLQVPDGHRADSARPAGELFFFFFFAAVCTESEHCYLFRLHGQCTTAVHSQWMEFCSNKNGKTFRSKRVEDFTMVNPLLFCLKSTAGVSCITR